MNMIEMTLDLLALTVDLHCQPHSALEVFAGLVRMRRCLQQVAQLAIRVGSHLAGLHVSLSKPQNVSDARPVSGMIRAGLQAAQGRQLRLIQVCRNHAPPVAIRRDRAERFGQISSAEHHLENLDQQIPAAIA